MAPISARNRRESGQTLVLFVFALGVLMGFTAMAIDVGMILHERRSLQNTADAAALAGVQELPESPSAAVAAATEWAMKNGYTADDGATITVNTPYQGDPEAVEVIIEEEVPFLFATVLGLESTGVHARAVAGNKTATAMGVALLVLDPEGDVSFDKSGTGDLIIDGGGAIMVNSASEVAIKRSGSGNIVTSGGFFHYYSGGWDNGGDSGQFIPEPEAVSFQMPDPLDGLAPPDPYAVGTSPDSGGTAIAPVTKKLSSGDHILRPGTYWGGIDIVSSANVILQPGVYVLAGGGLHLSGSGTVTGDGVFFYNTSDPWDQSSSGDAQCKKICFHGSADFAVTAPTAGPYEDIVFWQDKSCTVPMRHSGSGDFVSGVIYLPSARLDLSGTGNMGTVQIITDTVDISGSIDLTIDFQNLMDITLPPGHRLVE